MIFASNNIGKINEIKSIFKDYDIKSLKETGIVIEVEEDQDDFYKNALKKAKEIYDLAKKPVIADDSGLCIDILDNWPGVMTHRFLGKDATDTDRNNDILEKMKDYKMEKRKAHVVCKLVYYDGSSIVTGTGVLEGKIAYEKRGEYGFGFDEIFELRNGKTLAEILPEEKNKCSARSMACIDLKKKIDKLS